MESLVNGEGVPVWVKDPQCNNVTIWQFNDLSNSPIIQLIW